MPEQVNITSQIKAYLEKKCQSAALSSTVFRFGSGDLAFLLSCIPVCIFSHTHTRTLGTINKHGTLFFLIDGLFYCQKEEIVAVKHQ